MAANALRKNRYDDFCFDWLDERVGVGKAGEEGRAALRLCNLIAQSPRDAQGTV
jgi:hypothetical protein